MQRAGEEMVLKEIRLSNFRQFYGSQTLHFSLDSSKNITVVIGGNGGVGKTNLIHSIYWCLLGELLNSSDGITHLANNKAVSEGDLRASVEILLEHEGADYSVLRSFTLNQGGRFVQTCEVNQIEGGEIKKLNAGESFIRSILPDKWAEICLIEDGWRSPVADGLKQGPVLLDDPFGRLDSVHRLEAARILAQMETQILLMVQPFDYIGPVREALMENVGREYLLISGHAGASTLVDWENNLNGNKMPDGVIPLDIGCFRRKTEEEMRRELLDFFDPKNLEAVYRRMMAGFEKYKLPR
jgi:hypothetical protein